MEPKKALCIHDLSVLGRAALSVIGPIISAMGIQAVNLPTAVLSTHYGGFGPVAITDLTDFCEKALEHYERIGVDFDCVYSGFLSSVEQVGIVKKAFKNAKGSFKLCDPVMADHGKLYSSVTSRTAEGFKDLCSHSDLIIPNPTEALILLGRDYRGADSFFTKESAAGIVSSLAKRYSDVIMTGTRLDDGSVACVGYKKDKGEVFFIPLNYLPVSYPGTGDMFGACMAGFVLRGYSLEKACESSARFIETCVEATYKTGSDTKYGVHLEPMLSLLGD